MAPVDRWLLAGVIGVGGLVVLTVGLRQRSQTLQRNLLAGLRTSQTLASDEAWDAAHRATAGPIIAAGIVGIVTGIVAAILRSTEAVVATIGVGTAVLLVLVVGAGIHGHRLAKAVNEERTGDQ